MIPFQWPFACTGFFFLLYMVWHGMLWFFFCLKTGDDAFQTMIPPYGVDILRRNIRVNACFQVSTLCILFKFYLFMMKLFKWHLQNCYLNECKGHGGEKVDEKNIMVGEERASEWLREGYSNIRIKSSFFMLYQKVWI